MNESEPGPWLAGAAQVDITPSGSVFLYGYPHVARMSTGVHDPLLASALFLSDDNNATIFIACDLIWLPRELVHRARDTIHDATGIDAHHVLVSATHTHSGPVTSAMLSNADDATVPPPDPAYLKQLEQRIVQAAVNAHRSAVRSEVGFAVVDGSALGTNRRDPRGPSIPNIPVLIARAGDTGRPIAIMCVCSMHPTVLHEDWTMISGDFPGLARLHLQEDVIGRDCPLVYHMGASGNQSPRHVVTANTIDEARRLGSNLAAALAEGIEAAAPLPSIVACRHRHIASLPLREPPDADAAASIERKARTRLERLRSSDAPRAEVRTAECDWFGAEETLTLARAATDGRLPRAAAACLPAEVQLIRVGNQCFVGWPGEVFVEFAIEVRRQYPDAHIITLANDQLQGYLVTREAVEEGGYEASNAVFASPESGQRLVGNTLELLAEDANGAVESG